jgi:hypothetical protein
MLYLDENIRNLEEEERGGVISRFLPLDRSFLIK